MDPGPEPHLNPEEEKQLTGYLIEASDIGYSKTHRNVSASNECIGAFEEKEEKEEKKWLAEEEKRESRWKENLQESKKKKS